MNKEEHGFTKEVEKMIDPIEVGSIQFLQTFCGILPKKFQNKMISHSSKNYPYMGFVVEPYSFFLCYEIKDLEWAKSLIPDDFELVKTKIFEEDIPRYYSIFGCFNVHTSAFWGSRMEFNIIARNKKTQLLSWIIVDYDTNTISFDKAHGLSGGTTSHFIHTTDFAGNVIVDIQSKKNNRVLAFESHITHGEMTNLDQKLWLEGNFSVGYGREISLNSSDVFSLKFNPKEVEKALKISRKDIALRKNTWFTGLFDDEPIHMVCFPYAQHFLSDSPGHFSELRNKEEMVAEVALLDFSKIPVYTIQPLKRLILIGSFLPTLIIIMLLLLLII